MKDFHPTHVCLLNYESTHEIKKYKVNCSPYRPVCSMGSTLWHIKVFLLTDKMISSNCLNGVPLLVLANKQDIPDSMGVREVKPIFNQSAHLIGRRDCMVMPVSALTGYGKVILMTSIYKSLSHSIVRRWIILWKTTEYTQLNLCCSSSMQVDTYYGGSYKPLWWWRKRRQ